MDFHAKLLKTHENTWICMKTHLQSREAGAKAAGRADAVFPRRNTVVQVEPEKDTSIPLLHTFERGRRKSGAQNDPVVTI